MRHENDNFLRTKSPKNGNFMKFYIEKKVPEDGKQKIKI